LGIAERKSRERDERGHRITATARAIAEREGWGAVTIRRLAKEIEHSQPVIYQHFENREAIVAAVAIEGFRALAAALRQAAQGSTDRQDALLNVARAYLDFALEQPALYEAMFTLPTGLRFAEGDTKPELKGCFAALAAVVAPSGGDVEVATETFWAALHGLVELEHSGRIRPGMREKRLVLVVRWLLEC
jgi:AcrR family transcriptional regulator